MKTIVRNVKDLDTGERRACEGILGQALSDDQQLVIHVLTAGVEPSAEARDRALDCVRQFAAKARRNAALSGLTEDEIGRIIDDAIAAVRSRNA